MYLCLDNEKIVSLLFGILGGKIVSQYPCINQDCILNRDILHDLFPSEKRNDSKRPVSLYFINGKNTLKRVSHRNVFSSSEQAVTCFGSPLHVRRVPIPLVVAGTLELT